MEKSFNRHDMPTMVRAATLRAAADGMAVLHRRATTTAANCCKRRKRRATTALLRDDGWVLRRKSCWNQRGLVRRGRRPAARTVTGGELVMLQGQVSRVHGRCPAEPLFLLPFLPCANCGSDAFFVEKKTSEKPDPTVRNSTIRRARCDRPNRCAGPPAPSTGLVLYSHVTEARDLEQPCIQLYI